MIVVLMVVMKRRRGKRAKMRIGKGEEFEENPREKQLDEEKRKYNEQRELCGNARTRKNSEETKGRMVERRPRGRSWK